MTGVARAQEALEPEFRAHVSEREGVRVVDVDGPLDLVSAPHLTRVLARPAAPTVVDLASCSFADSSGIAALIGAHREHFAAGHAFALVVRPASNVSRVLHVTGIVHVLAAYPALEPALEAIRS